VHLKSGSKDLDIQQRTLQINEIAERIGDNNNFIILGDINEEF